ncbi:hypothetical protein CB1_000228031 [Camelus ferus]|nr:hypothetical protein CB1_000228031 [Camelus ferus]
MGGVAPRAGKEVQGPVLIGPTWRPPALPSHPHADHGFPLSVLEVGGTRQAADSSGSAIGVRLPPRTAEDTVKGIALAFGLSVVLRGASWGLSSYRFPGRRVMRDPGKISRLGLMRTVVLGEELRSVTDDLQ